MWSEWRVLCKSWSICFITKTSTKGVLVNSLLLARSGNSIQVSRYKNRYRAKFWQEIAWNIPGIWRTSDCCCINCSGSSRSIAWQSRCSCQGSVSWIGAANEDRHHDNVFLVKISLLGMLNTANFGFPFIVQTFTTVASNPSCVIKSWLLLQHTIRRAVFIDW